MALLPRATQRDQGNDLRPSYLRIEERELEAGGIHALEESRGLTRTHAFHRVLTAPSTELLRLMAPREAIASAKVSRAAGRGSHRSVHFCLAPRECGRVGAESLNRVNFAHKEVTFLQRQPMMRSWGRGSGLTAAALCLLG